MSLESVTVRHDIYATLKNTLFTDIANNLTDIALSISSDMSTADQVFIAPGTLVAAADTFNLDTGETDPQGNAVNMAKVHAIFFRNNSAVDFELFGASNIPVCSDSSDKITVPAGGLFTFVSDTGITVTASTADSITVSAAIGEEYDLIILGS